MMNEFDEFDLLVYRIFQTEQMAPLSSGPNKMYLIWYQNNNDRTLNLTLKS